MDGAQREFPPFRLDLANTCLWHENACHPLMPKDFAVLAYLTAHPGQLVSHKELLDAVWSDAKVHPGVLKVCLRRLRLALSDSATQPRFIETIHRRGYRFIAAITTQPVQSPKSKVQSLRVEPTPTPQSPTPSLVGRATERAQLHSWLERALGGERQCVFITGEPGIGKTALVEAFLFGVQSHEKFGVSTSPKSKVQSPNLRTPNSEPPSTPQWWVGRGQCIEHYGSGEAYLPILEALERLGRGVHGGRLLASLRHAAPSWLAHLPSLISEEERVALRQHGSDATQVSLMRELATALEEATAEQPVILWLEDLHWSDTATIEFLATLMRRQEAARVLVMGTYRPLEMFHDNHPCKGMMHELLGHDLCHELRLTDLSEADVAQYLTLRFAAPDWVPQVAQAMHQRSGGNPLFVVQIVNELVNHKIVTQTNEQWIIEGDPATIATSLPDTIRHLVARQSERLCPEEQQILEAASVAGQEFSTAAVAAALEQDGEMIEESCQRLADSGYFLRRAGVEEWPDGRVTERYGFVHALYQQLWHERVAAQRRQHWHHRIGERLAAAYGDQTGTVAAELALHFEQGHDYSKAVQYRQRAATNATHRYAYTEAIGHLTAGLNLLHHERNPLARAQLELRLQTSLGAALVVTKGYSAAEVEQAYHRARQLCEQLRETPQVVPILFGLWQFYLLRGELQTARKLAEQLVTRTEHSADPVWLIRGQLALGVTWYYGGDLPTARAHLEKGAALSSHADSRGGAAALGSLLIACLAYLAQTLWYLGYPEQALQRKGEMLSLAKAQSQPFALAIAVYHAACLHQLRREVALTQEQADVLLAQQQEHRFEFYRAGATILHGWAQAETRQHTADIEQENHSLAVREAVGAQASQPHFLAVLAETCGKLGRATEGLTLLAEALSIAQRKHTQIYMAELYRLTGELTLQKGTRDWRLETSSPSPQAPSRLPPPSGGKPLAPSGVVEEVEGYFLKAIDIARKQQAKSLELRAVMSLGRLRQQQASEEKSRNTQHETHARLAQAHQMLSEIYEWFTEGFDTKDLQEAKALIEELRH